MKRLITFSLIIFTALFSYSQNNWPKKYGDNYNVYSNDVFETYDKGYLLVGNFGEGGLTRNGWIIKTDINGEVLWNKRIGVDPQCPIYKVTIGKDGNFYIIGSSYKLDSRSDAMIMKLNPCGEEEWCKIFHVPNDPEYGVGICQLPSGNLIALINYYGTDIQNERIWLFKLSPDGEVIWEKLYGQQYPELFNEDAYEIYLTHDYNIIISATCYYPNPENPNLGWVRPFFLKVDSAGNELWELPWGIEEYVYGNGFCATEDRYGNYYGGGRHTEDRDGDFMDHPVLFKFSKDGEQMYYKDIVDFSEYGLTNTVDFYNDTTIVMTGGWCMTTDTCHENCYILDTLGNIIRERQLIISISAIRGADITYDGKILVTGGFCKDGNCDIYFWKLNNMLEDDTLYTQSYTYDSLCPYPIVSDTIACNCQVVNIEEQANGQLQLYNSWVYPNPAHDWFKIQCPVVSPDENSNKRFTIEVFNTLGEKVHQITTQPGQTLVKINSTGWQKGMYVVRLISEGAFLKSNKIIIN